MRTDSFASMHLTPKRIRSCAPMDLVNCNSVTTTSSPNAVLAGKRFVSSGLLELERRLERGAGSNLSCAKSSIKQNVRVVY